MDNYGMQDKWLTEITRTVRAVARPGPGPDGVPYEAIWQPDPSKATRGYLDAGRVYVQTGLDTPVNILCRFAATSAYFCLAGPAVARCPAAAEHPRYHGGTVEVFAEYHDGPKFFGLLDLITAILRHDVATMHRAG